MEFIPNVTISSQFSTATGQVGVSGQALPVHPAESWAMQRSNLPFPSRAKCSLPSSRGLQRVLKTRRAQQTEQGTRPFLLHSRTRIVCVHKHLLLPQVLLLHSYSSSFG